MPVLGQSGVSSFQADSLSFSESAARQPSSTVSEVRYAAIEWLEYLFLGISSGGSRYVTGIG
jgi:hypothetical protein